MVFMSVCMDVHISICTHVHICEKNLKDIRPSVHVYMQMGVYIRLFACVCAYMCGSVYVNTCNIWMMLVC